jgi:SLOG cluster3 family/TIR domain
MLGVPATPGGRHPLYDWILDRPHECRYADTNRRAGDREMSSTLFVISPEASAVDQPRASTLLDAAKAEWEDLPVSILSPGAVTACAPGPGDAIIFFNPPCAEHAEAIEELLDEGVAAGAVLLPIALDPDDRRPPGSAGDKQSFDVTDQLRRRDLPDDRLEPIGATFAREAMSMIMPTFVRTRLRLFLCHRRSDGEALTARIDQSLSARHEHVFRDLIDIQIGDEAQATIDEKLAGADALVFLDTPDAGTSWWVTHELATALGRNIPVVWVRLGPEDDRPELLTVPAAEPHIAAADTELDAARAGAIADEILNLAVRLAKQHGRASHAGLRRLKRWAAETGATFEVLDARQLIFQIRYPVSSAARAYPLRPATDIVQVFGRACDSDDEQALERYLTEHGMGPHDHECRAFDAAILLDPTSTGHRLVGDWSVAEHPERFLGSLQTAPGIDDRSPRLLLLGAFPNGDLARDQVAPAVHATASTWLRLGGTIVCGGHPTFTPLLVEAARNVLGDDARDRLVIYQSAWYVAPAAASELNRVATVRLIDGADTREASLTTMRDQMVTTGQADAVLAIGGRTEEGGAHVPGIDEEIGIARRHGLPVYLLGAPGGQAARLASAFAADPQPWSRLGNALAPDENRFLQTTEAFEDAARMIWNATAD